MKVIKQAMSPFVYIVAIAFLLIGCNSESFVNEVNLQRTEKYNELIDSTRSRFNADERAQFEKKRLSYFKPDISYNIDATFSIDTSTLEFQMATTTDRRPNYRIYGYLDFWVNDTACKLTVYQNVDSKDHPEHGLYLFVPFKDNTNEFSTYGGGRYIDILIPDGIDTKIDFNSAYNPYCSYNDRWSCPLVPAENHLDVAIFAGEKKYK